MNYKNLIKLFLILALSNLGCGLASPVSVLPTIDPSLRDPTLSAPIVTAPSLTVEQLANAQYQLGARDDHAIVQLTDRKYQQMTGSDYARIVLSDFVSIGDLTGDGVNESAAIIFEDYGGTGNFAFLAIYQNVNGLPVFLTSTLIDDRPKINSLSIENGAVFLDATIHGPQDPGCCPALPTTRRYTLVYDQLRLVNSTTSTPTGATRTIKISSPLTGTDASGSVQVSGNVSIAPFENTLAWFIYDESGKQLSNSSLTVSATDLGGPGTFSEAISLQGISTGTIIYLEIHDINAADGSLLAMDSVKLTVR